jgi:hypothetical protein
VVHERHVLRLNSANLCVAVPGGVTTDETKLKLATCSSATSHQQFSFTNSQIKTSNKAFNISGGTIATGNRVILYTDNSAN